MHSNKHIAFKAQQRISLSFLCICNLFYVSVFKDVLQDKDIKKVKKG